MKVVAIQPRVALGEVERNLAHLEDLIGQAAREHAPQAIFLPESMTTPNLYHRSMRTVARDRRRRRRCRCCGARRASTTASSAAASSPCAAPTRAARTRSSSPTARSTCTTRTSPRSGRTTTTPAGEDDGVVRDLARPDRPRQRLRVGPHAHGGSACSAACGCWPAGCTSPRSRPGRLTKPWFWDRDHEALLQYARETPAAMARILGVPAVHPSHVGDVRDGDAARARRRVADDLRRRDARSATPTA